MVDEENSVLRPNPNPDYADDTRMLQLRLDRAAEAGQLNDVEQALVDDTVGLMMAISSREVLSGQSRIRDNIIRLMESVGIADGSSLDENMRKTCRDVLRDGAAMGITIEGYKLGREKTRWQGQAEGR